MVQIETGLAKLFRDQERMMIDALVAKARAIELTGEHALIELKTIARLRSIASQLDRQPTFTTTAFTNAPAHTPSGI